ncbi:MAG TPA: hypothetical protein VD995_24745 [Azospirillum sp.]|nr:hypothetical protein [Azospirillum sp.]
MASIIRPATTFLNTTLLNIGDDPRHMANALIIQTDLFNRSQSGRQEPPHPWCALDAQRYLS